MDKKRKVIEEVDDNFQFPEGNERLTNLDMDARKASVEIDPYGNEGILYLRTDGKNGVAVIGAFSFETGVNLISALLDREHTKNIILESVIRLLEKNPLEGMRFIMQLHSRFTNEKED